MFMEQRGTVYVLMMFLRSLELTSSFPPEILNDVLDLIDECDSLLGHGFIYYTDDDFRLHQVIDVL